MTTPAPAAVRPTRLPLFVALAGGAIAGVLVGLALTTTAAVPGIIAPGAAVVVGLPLSRVLIDTSALVTVGLSILPRLITDDRRRRVAAVLASARRIAVLSAAVWVVAALGSLVLEVADTNAGQPVTFGAITEYVRRIASGQALVIVACCASVYLVIGLLAVRRGESVPVELRSTVAMFALLPLPIAGHAAAGDDSWQAVGVITMELHVLAAVTWTGGLLAVMLLLAADRWMLADALPRFSTLATLCVFATGITGAFGGWFVLYRTPGIHWYVALFTTGYGWILLGKIVCVLAAGLLGGYTRFALLPRIAARRTTAVLTWATMEIAVLAVAFGLSAVLVRAPVVTGAASVPLGELGGGRAPMAQSLQPQHRAMSAPFQFGPVDPAGRVVPVVLGQHHEFGEMARGPSSAGLGQPGQQRQLAVDDLVQQPGGVQRLAGTPSVPRSPHVTTPTSLARTTDQRRCRC